MPFSRYLKEILYILGDERDKLPILLIIFIGVSVLDLLGISVIAPYIQLAMNPTDHHNILGGLISTMGFPKDQVSLLSIFGGIMIIIFSIKSALALFVHRIIIKFSLDKMGDIRSQLLDSYQNMQYLEYAQRNSSEYIYAIQTLSNQYAVSVLRPFLLIMSNSILAFIILCFLAWHNITALTLLLMMSASALFIYDLLFKNKLILYGKKANTASTYLLQGINESISGFKEVRVLNKERYFYNFVDKNAKKYSEYSAKAQVISTMPRYILELIMVIFVVILTIITVHSNNTEELFITLAVFGVAAFRLLPSLNALSTSISKLRNSRNSVSILYNDLQNTQQSNTKQKQTVSISNKERFKKLELINIDFNYPGQIINTLNDLSLTVYAGDAIGLVGVSGSGKTTLIDLIIGLLDPNKGVIKYNNRSIKGFSQELTSNVAYIPQDTLLIDNTLRKNIALGEDDNDINESRLDKSIQQSKLVELVDQLPQGKDTFIGEKGVRLSGGQRQRIALARAIYHNRDVLIMDESTSALDVETEKEIMEEIELLKGEKTMIIISHRPSILEHCDHIYELKEGCLISRDNDLIIKKS